MNADVIVIGAGIVGAACAHELARAGLGVLVLDAGLGGATQAGMGHLVVMDDNPAELTLSHESLKIWHDWAPRMNADCAFATCGTLWLAANDAEMAVAEDKRRCLQAHGVACELLGAAALAAAEPVLRPGLAGALKVSGDSVVYAPNAARASSCAQAAPTMPAPITITSAFTGVCPRRRDHPLRSAKWPRRSCGRARAGSG